MFCAASSVALPGCLKVPTDTDEPEGGVKAPKSIAFVDSIPRTAAGKMDKKALRAPYWGGADRMVN